MERRLLGPDDALPAERDLVLEHLALLHDTGAFWLFGYVVMPEHIQLLIAPRQAALTRLVRDLKSRCGFALAQGRGRRGPIWQERYFDHILRRVRDFWQKLDYIHQNPVAAGLVKRAEDWAWSSYGFYAKVGSVRICPDPVELPADSNVPLWPAPWRTS